MNKPGNKNLFRKGLVFFFLALMAIMFTVRLAEVGKLGGVAQFGSRVQYLAGIFVEILEKQGFTRELLIADGAPIIGSVNREVVYSGRRRLLTLSFYTLTRVDITDPRTFFALQMPVAAMEENQAYNPGDPEKEGPILELIPETQPAPGPPGPALVGIYNTHNSESYAGDGGGLYEQGNGEVSQVAAALAASLEKLGIPVVRSTKIHDLPRLDQAYGQSIITASQMVKDNPKLQALLDIHRDGLPEGRSKRVINIGGKSAAPVMIVLGMHHVNWQKNEQFAKDLLAKGNEMFPGLFLQIHYATEARYNQHLLPHALLLEFGDQYNTTQEAENSAEAVAQVLDKLLQP